MHPANTVSAAAKVKNKSRGQTQQRTSTGEIDQNLLTKIQLKQTQSKCTNTEPNTSKLWQYKSPIVGEKRTGIGAFTHHIESFKTLATYVQKHTRTLTKKVHLNSNKTVKHTEQVHVTRGMISSAHFSPNFRDKTSPTPQTSKQKPIPGHSYNRPNVGKISPDSSRGDKN